MSEMPWVRFFPSDWLGGTRAMSASETGIYITLIATMYERGEPIPVDHARMARLCGASNSVFKACLKALIDDGKIIETEKGLWNDRVQKEVVYRQEKSQVGLQAANARWDKKRNEINVNDDALAMPSQCARNANQKPEPDIKERDTNVSLKKNRGSRIPEGFEPDTELAMRMGLTSSQAENEAAKFKDYWASVSGAKGVKQDWLATWRNWVRSAVERLPRGSPSSPFQKPRNISEASTRLLAEIRKSENANPQSRTAGELFEQVVPYLAAPNRQR